jgi:hypothetical protein
MTSRYRLMTSDSGPSLARLRRAAISVVWSFVYLALRRSLELVLLCFGSAEAKEIGILVLHTQRRCCAASTTAPSAAHQPCA